MASLTHPTPGDLSKDEEKFLKIFSKKSLAFCLIACLPGVVIYRLLAAFGLGIVGLLLWAALVITTFIATSYVLPVENYRYKGGGQPLYIVWIRKLYRKWNKNLYIKHNDVNQQRKAGKEVF